MKIKIYIDFDGVIQDTWNIIFHNYKKKYHTNVIDETNLKKSMLDLGWNFILENSKEINGSFEKIYYLMRTYNVFIITKVNSIEEQNAKTLFLNSRNIFNIIFVPYGSSKSDFINPYGTILIDDVINNLEEWEQRGGIPVLFNEYMKNVDSYGNRNDKFIIIDDLLKIYDIIKIDRRRSYMNTKIVLTGILKATDEFLVVKRSENDDLYPGAWEFPGGHLEKGETLKEGLKRELFEEIGFNSEFEPIITHYYDEVKNKNDELIHDLEIDFIINVNKSDVNVILSEEHCDYKWVKKDSELLDDYIKDKLSNI